MNKLNYVGVALLLVPIVAYQHYLTFQEAVLLYLLFIGLTVHGIRNNE